MAETKTCPICGNPFSRINHISNDRWRQQVTCSRVCSVVYRKKRTTGDHHVLSPRERSKAALAKRWGWQQADTARYGKSLPIRPTREEEVDAIARFVAERGVKRLDPVEAEVIPARQETQRPQPMAGWRG